jgi:hypothetical protein
MKIGFSQRIFEKYSNLKESCPVGTELFHTERRTNERTDRHDEANSRFSNFANTPKNDTLYEYIIL